MKGATPYGQPPRRGLSQLAETDCPRCQRVYRLTATSASHNAPKKSGKARDQKATSIGCMLSLRLPPGVIALRYALHIARQDARQARDFTFFLWRRK